MLPASPEFDVFVVGAGAVGVAVAREFTLLGKSVVICEKNQEVLAEASSGNTGHLATNFYYTRERAPLEYELTRRATVLNKEWINKQINVPRVKRGILYVAYSEEDARKLESMRDIGKSNGEDVRLLRPSALRSMEPNLNTSTIVSALHSPEEYVVDSWLLAMSNLYEARQHGCVVETGTCVEGAVKEEDGRWTVNTSKGGFKAGLVVNCAGNYGDRIEAFRMNNNPQRNSFVIQPAKGEYCVYDTSVRGMVKNMILVAPQPQYAGPYIFESVYGHTVVGPTKVPQNSRDDRTCDPIRLSELQLHAQGLFPALRKADVIDTYCGLRPACQYADYQIHFDEDHRWVTVGGIRSTGLTTSRAIAEFVARTVIPDHAAVVRKPEVVMPEAVVRAGDVIIGDEVHRPTHKLSQLGLGRDSVQLPYFKGGI